MYTCIMHDLRIIGCLSALLLLAAVSSSRITLKDNASNRNFLEKSSNEITQILLKSAHENETNFICSPFGHSVILGILSEGADGATKDELERVLHLPNDINLIRQTFKRTLERLQDRSKNSTNPEFRNYFYVYKNFSVNEHYKNVLFENYFTDVKSVYKPTYEEDFENETAAAAAAYPTDRHPQISTVIPPVVVKDPAVPIVLLKHQTPLYQKSSRNLRLRRLARRFLGIDLTETKSKGEVSSLSTSRLNTENLTSSFSRMIIFNGLYFKGIWKSPFQYKQGDEIFYTSNGTKITTETMYSVGLFNVGHLPELDSVALSIPYKGERYSFLIILPNANDGIKSLIDNLTNIEFSRVISTLEPRHIQVTIPSFDFKTISHLKKPLSDIGIQKIFTREANFDYISKNSGLFVDDIVQLVTINVDNDAGTPNFLTASSVQTRTVTEKFTADHPFAFFIRDHKENLIIASGILYEPTRDY